MYKKIYMFQITSQQPSQFSIYRCYGILCKIFFQIRRQDGQKKNALRLVYNILQSTVHQQQVVMENHGKKRKF